MNFEGFIYPNEAEIYWSVLIAVYPYITGLVAGAFIVASLLRVFNVAKLRPVYRLSLLTALAFLLTAPLPLVAHLGHPERAFEIMFTPHSSSAMAGFGFIYAWYLLVVLLLEIYYDYRKDIVSWASRVSQSVIKGFIYRILTLGDRDVSEEAVESDEKVVYWITVIGLPSAAFLHGYVGFIFGSVKANPWWSSPLTPIIFLFSAMVSGIALVMMIYVFGSKLRGKKPDAACVDTLASYLLYSYILDLSLEFVELTHIFYAAEEGTELIARLIVDKLFLTFVGIQMVAGALIPILLIVLTKLFKPKMQTAIFTLASILTLIGVFAMRWNVVIGGQILSKTLRGFSSYSMPVFGAESLTLALGILALPFVILYILSWLLPPWEAES
ncbi:MAG: polysulfide reductase NrfD [Archaeoglobus sp.]|nr:polysulfide reductase NrfD [Archaeoglobus sp.]